MPLHNLCPRIEVLIHSQLFSLKEKLNGAIISHTVFIISLLWTFLSFLFEVCGALIVKRPYCIGDYSTGNSTLTYIFDRIIFTVICSPLSFLSQKPPVEIFLSKSNKKSVLRRGKGFMQNRLK